MKEIIDEIVKDPDVDLGYEYVPQVDETKFVISDDEIYGFDYDRKSSESDKSDKSSLFGLDTKKSQDMMDIQLKTLDFKKLMGVSNPREKIASIMLSKVKIVKAKVIEKKRQQKKKYNRKEIQ